MPFFTYQIDADEKVWKYLMIGYDKIGIIGPFLGGKLAFSKLEMFIPFISAILLLRIYFTNILRVQWYM